MAAEALWHHPGVLLKYAVARMVRNKVPGPGPGPSSAQSAGICDLIEMRLRHNDSFSGPQDAFIAAEVSKA